MTSLSRTLAFACAALALPLAGIKAETLSDPTRPANRSVAAPAAAGQPQALRVEAILHCEQRCVAIIDGKLLHEGERIADALIEQISSDAVRYSRNGKIYISALDKTMLQVRQIARQEK